MNMFRFGFQQGRAREQMDREQLDYLRNAPLPQNPPALTAPTRCQVMRAFCIAGQRQEPGAEVTLPRFDAISLAAIKKLEILGE